MFLNDAAVKYMVCGDYLCMRQAVSFQHRVNCLIMFNCVSVEQNGSNFSNIQPVFCISSCCVLNKFKNFSASFVFGALSIKFRQCMQERVRLRTLEQTRVRGNKHWRGYKDWTLQGHQPTSTTIRPTLRGTGPFSSSKRKKK